MKAIFSTERIDAANEIMKLDGGDFSRFNTNPVLLFVHNDESFPVGTVINLRIENSQLVGEIQWDELDEVALKIKGKYDRGVMRGFSIRARVLKFHEEGSVRVITEWELLEISCVSIPSNKDCLVIEKSIKSKIEGQEQESELPEIVRIDFFSNQFLKKNMEQVFKRLGLVAKEQQTEDLVMKKISELEQRANNAEAEVSKKLTEVSVLKSENEALKSEAETQKINTLIDGAVQAKKITPGEADSYKKLAKSDFDAVKSLIDAKKGVQLPRDTQAQGEENETLKAYNEHRSKGYMWFMKHKPDVLADLKKNYPTTFKQFQDSVS